MVSENTESDHDTRVDIPVNRKVMTRLGKGLRNAYIHTEAPTISDFCSAAGVSYHWMCNYIRADDEPTWMKNLRAVKRASGVSWDDILGR